MKANLPAKAARLALRIQHLANDSDILERIAAALLKGSFYERVSLFKLC